MTRILGIESSCDETAAAILEDGARILSSVVASQMSTHQPYGGVVPELASREHLRAVVPVVRDAFAQAGLQYGDVQAVAVTQGPGLVGALLVGITYAKALAWSLNVPLIAVNHLEGHVHAVLLEQRLRNAPEPEFPTLALLVSGGHTLLVVAQSPAQFEIVGRTRDDAAGEAFDKVGKLLGLSYPGGPVIDKLAKRGNAHAVAFTPPKIKGNPLDFSFSGIKTAVLRMVQARPELKVKDDLEQITPASLDLIASFQHAVVEDLWTRTRIAARQFDVRSVMVTGGVACNSALRERFTSTNGLLDGLPVFFPRPSLTTDNAAMIAAAAFPRFASRQFAGMDLTASPQLPLV